MSVYIVRTDENGIITDSQEYSSFMYEKKSPIIMFDLYGRKLFDIFVDELGCIRYNDNKLAWAWILRHDTQRTLMNIMGKLAEVIIVKRCLNDSIANQKWLSIGKFYKITLPIIQTQQFKAIGTGLLSTEKNYHDFYNPQDTQRDVIWIDGNNIPALQVGSTTTRGSIAGLQIKASTDGMNYVYGSLVNHQYCVPMVYFGIGAFNDYAKIATNLCKNTQLDYNDLKYVFVDAQEIDYMAYEELKSYVPIIQYIIENNVDPAQLLNFAETNGTLRTAIAATSILQTPIKNQILY